ncbi:hypothetical protein C100_19925 [Sphingobium sp. C100]|uniref:DUF2285 domain-containing protein n=1 Tax=Sphingobium sp. C100 TaxID=1207055 RepID=UPI0003D6069F|nr:DUF2285 domain-containing protein [Sphingobium sp. C100]ETI60087.1 hypothetical protein C100_19925 [Sphingobium sp. C100]
MRYHSDQITVNNILQFGYISRSGDVVTKDDFLDQPPAGAALTAYDEAHLKLYVRLLDADAEKADWREVVEVLFGLDAKAEPERAQRIYTSHLDRAKLMTKSGFCELLQGRLH